MAAGFVPLHDQDIGACGLGQVCIALVAHLIDHLLAFLFQVLHQAGIHIPEEHKRVYF